MATKPPRISMIKAKMRTPTMTSEYEGTLKDAIPYFLFGLKDPAERPEVIAECQKNHLTMVENAAKRAAKTE